MTASAENLNTLWGDLIIEELVRSDVDVFCLAPGSRSTPLTAAAARNPGARILLHLDERGAAYAALGAAKACGRPAAFICTSGTAAANALPAIVEASFSHTPLVILTADRPPEALESGVNQTIRQAGLYGGNVRWAITLPCPDPAVSATALLTTIDQAIHRAASGCPGPVHINCPFREPLIAPRAFDAGYMSDLAGRWLGSQQPFTSYTAAPRVPSAQTISSIAAALAPCPRGLLIVGALDCACDAEAIAALAQKMGWPVFADIASGLRLGQYQPPFIPFHDLALANPSFHGAAQPEMILHIGGRFTSKRITQLIETAKPAAYIQVAAHPEREDPEHRVTMRIEAEIACFCQALMETLPEGLTNERTAMLHDLSQRAWHTARGILATESAITEPETLMIVPENAPDNAFLFLGNSMPIRDAQMFAPATERRTRVRVNRGASGIDGNIATLAGIAFAGNAPAIGIIGDLAALHDLNSLAMLAASPQPVVLIIINNHGGGIFHFLPIAEYPDVFEPYFTAPHKYGFAQAAAMFNLPYAAPSTPAELAQTLTQAFASGQSTLIEVHTDRAANQALHTRIIDVIRMMPAR